MKKLFWLTLAVWGITWVGCGPLVVVDPTVVTGDCARACANLAWLACPGWQGSPGEDEQYGTTDDIRCEDACALLAGHAELDFQLGCAARAADCAAYEACYQ